MNVKPPVVKICGHCGAEFRRPPSLARTKFCGLACYQAHYATKEKVCQQCGKTYRRGGPRRCGGTGGKFCSKECQALAQIRRVEFRCKDCGRVEMRTPNEARRFQRCGECGAAYRATRLKGQPLPSVTDPVARENWLKALRAPEHRERMREMVTGREMQTEITRRGSARHFKALHFTVRTPAGVPYQVDNLCEFVRSHQHLFDPADVVGYRRQSSSYQSRATVGLGRLQAASGKVLSWKGWTLTFGCRDELGRQAMSPEAIRVYENN